MRVKVSALLGQLCMDLIRTLSRRRGSADPTSGNLRIERTESLPTHPSREYRPPQVAATRQRTASASGAARTPAERRRAAESKDAAQTRRPARAENTAPRKPRRPRPAQSPTDVDPPLSPDLALSSQSWSQSTPQDSVWQRRGRALKPVNSREQKHVPKSAGFAALMSPINTTEKTTHTPPQNSSQGSLPQRSSRKNILAQAREAVPMIETQTDSRSRAARRRDEQWIAEERERRAAFSNKQQSVEPPTTPVSRSANKRTWGAQLKQSPATPMANPDMHHTNRKDAPLPATPMEEKAAHMRRWRQSIYATPQTRPASSPNTSYEQFDDAEEGSDDEDFFSQSSSAHSSLSTESEILSESEPLSEEDGSFRDMTDQSSGSIAFDDAQEGAHAPQPAPIRAARSATQSVSIPAPPQPAAKPAPQPPSQQPPARHLDDERAKEEMRRERARLELIEQQREIAERKRMVVRMERERAKREQEMRERERQLALQREREKRLQEEQAAREEAERQAAIDEENRRRLAERQRERLAVEMRERARKAEREAQESAEREAAEKAAEDERKLRLAIERAENDARRALELEATQYAFVDDPSSEDDFATEDDDSEIEEEIVDHAVRDKQLAAMLAEKEKHLVREKAAHEKQFVAERISKENQMAAERAANEKQLGAEREAKARQRAAEHEVMEQQLAAEREATEKVLAAERAAAEKRAAEERAAREKQAAEKRAVDEKRMAEERAAREKREAEEKEIREKEAAKLRAIQEEEAKQRAAEEAAAERVHIAQQHRMLEERALKRARREVEDEDYLVRVSARRAESAEEDDGESSTAASDDVQSTAHSETSGTSRFSLSNVQIVSNNPQGTNLRGILVSTPQKAKGSLRFAESEMPKAADIMIEKHEALTALNSVLENGAPRFPRLISRTFTSSLIGPTPGAGVQIPPHGPYREGAVKYFPGFTVHGLADTSWKATPAGERLWEQVGITMTSWLVLYLDIVDLRVLMQTSRIVRQAVLSEEVREAAACRILGPVGYAPWDGKDPLPLTLLDLEAFTVYTTVQVELRAAAYIYTTRGHRLDRRIPRIARASLRAYCKVLARLRAAGRQPPAQLWVTAGAVEAPYMPGVAAVFRVWTPEDDKNTWTSSNCIQRAERELFLAGVWRFLDSGDVVYNVTKNDKYNDGRYIFNKDELVPLSNAHDKIGHSPPVIDMMQRPPTFYRDAIRFSGAGPVVYLDLLPFRSEILRTLHLARDNVETASGNRRYRINKWVYRASTEIFTPQGGSEFGTDRGWNGTLALVLEGTAENARELVRRCVSPRESDVLFNAISSMIIDGGEAPQELGPAELPLDESGTRMQYTFPWQILRERSAPGFIWISML